MFIEMDKQVLPFKFGSAAMWLRYDINAFYNIEKSGYSPFDIISQSGDPKAVRCFLENGLRDWYYGDGVDDYHDIDSYINGLMSAEGFQIELVAIIQSAVLLALPPAPHGKPRKKNNEDMDILGLLTAFVDIMKAPRSEFMSSTIREAKDRWDRYAVAMGYQEPVETFKRFDDDD